MVDEIIVTGRSGTAAAGIVAAGNCDDIKIHARNVRQTDVIGVAVSNPENNIVVIASHRGIGISDDYQRVLFVEAVNNIAALAVAVNVDVASVIAKIFVDSFGIITNGIVAFAAVDCVAVAYDKEHIVACAAVKRRAENLVSADNVISVTAGNSSDRRAGYKQYVLAAAAVD